MVSTEGYTKLKCSEDPEAMSVDTELTVTETTPYLQRNVLIIGNTNAGKATIIKHLIDEAGGEVISTDDKSRWEVKCRTDILLSLNKVDASYKMFTSAQGKKQFIPKLKEQIGVQDVHLIMLVYRHGYFTREERDIFQHITKHLSKEARLICFLIVTGCENLNDHKKKEAVNIEQNRIKQDSTPILAYVKDVCCVGFPNMEDVMPKVQTVYPPIIAESRKELMELVEKSKDFVPTVAIFSPNVVPVNPEPNLSSRENTTSTVHPSMLQRVFSRCNIL